jgi:hypothetical protein
VSALTIIVLVIVFWTLFVVGVLIGVSIHREATRRRVHRLDLEEYQRRRRQLETSMRGPTDPDDD